MITKGDNLPTHVVQPAKPAARPLESARGTCIGLAICLSRRILADSDRHPDLQRDALQLKQALEEYNKLLLG